MSQQKPSYPASNKIGADNRAPPLQFCGFGFFIVLVPGGAALTGSVSDRTLDRIVTPSKLQYFFAADWPARIWIVTIPVLCALATGFSSPPSTETFRRWTDALLFLGIIGVALLLGFFVAILIGWFVLGPLYYGRSLKNGEPFHEGESVHILVGPYRGRIARVCKAWDIAPWAGAHRLQVDLGATERADGKDVFKSYEIFRVAPADVPV